MYFLLQNLAFDFCKLYTWRSALL